MGTARVLALVALAGLSACVAPSGQGPASSRGSPGLILAPEALQVAGTGQEIGFGRAPDNAIAAVTARAGGAPVADLIRPDCPGAALREVRFPDGLSLWFRDRMLVGWSVTDATPGRYSTASGLTTGLDRDAALALPDTAATQSGLSAGAIRGRVGADGRLARLEAGKTCG